MTACPKCLGLLVSDDYGFQREVPTVRCVNCGLRIISGLAINFPPFHANEATVQRHLVLLKREPLTDQQLAHRLYMRTYMVAYRKKHRTVGLG